MKERDVMIEKDGIVHVLHIDEDGVPTEKKKESKEDQYKLIVDSINGEGNTYKRGTCYYCGISLDNDYYNYKQSLYELKSVSYLLMRYRYFERKIKIPRCERCSKKHSNYLIIFNLIPFVITFIAFFLGLFESLADIIWSALAAYSVALLVIFLMNFIFGKLLFKLVYKIPNRDDTKKYPAVRELLKLGLKRRRIFNNWTKDVVNDDKDWLISKIISTNFST